jgi:phage/plasmid-associated DNA primase
LKSTLHSIVAMFSKLNKQSSDAKSRAANHKQKHSIHEPVSPLSTAARVQKKKAKKSARKLKAVEHQAGQEKRAEDGRAAQKRKTHAKSNAKAKKKKVKAKTTTAKKITTAKKPKTAKKSPKR